MQGKEGGEEGENIEGERQRWKGDKGMRPEKKGVEGRTSLCSLF